MPSWVLLLISNTPYIYRTILTIQDARMNGKWVDDIVLLVPSNLLNDEWLLRVCHQLKTHLVELPNNHLNSVFTFWNKHTEHPSFQYSTTRYFQHMKYYIFHPLLKKWDYIFYLDGGAFVFGDMNRFKAVCTRDDCIYADLKHGRVCWYDLFDDTQKGNFNSLFKLDKEVMLSTCMIFHSNIIENDTAAKLFELLHLFPAVQGDQEIMSLYFHQFKNQVVQIPKQDTFGKLYTWSEEPGTYYHEYIIIKYPNNLPTNLSRTII